MRLIVRDIRIFSGRHETEIRPLTILVGENSSGKSTFLALLSAVHDPVGFPISPSFNDEPYDLGNFETILTAKGTRATRPTEFSLGFSDGAPGSDGFHEIIGSYCGSRGLVKVSRLTMKRAADFIDISINGKTGSVTLGRRGVEPVSASFEVRQPLNLPSVTSGLIDKLVQKTSFAEVDLSEPTEFAKLMANKDFRRLMEIQVAVTRLISADRPRAISIAPIRTKPKRTYDQYNVNFSPEGNHIPVMLANLSQAPEDMDRFNRLRAALTQFGRESSLYHDIQVRTLGKSGEPFQLRVNINGLRPSIADVGYGVSQSLPIIVQSVITESKTTLLLQQPEVHLHPKAQAALGTFFSALASNDHRFVIETHSDFLLDRIRREVAAGKIAHTSVGILFFENRSGRTTIHDLQLDERGNFLKVPKSYRRFFIQEEVSLLSR